MQIGTFRTDATTIGMKDDTTAIDLTFRIIDRDRGIACNAKHQQEHKESGYATEPSRYLSRLMSSENMSKAVA